MTTRRSKKTESVCRFAEKSHCQLVSDVRKPVIAFNFAHKVLCLSFRAVPYPSLAPHRKDSGMSHPTYAWQELYLAAVYETDNNKLAGRILEATSAIEQRLLSPVEDDDEYTAIRNAQKGLQTLKAERCNGGDDRDEFPLSLDPQRLMPDEA
jgi:hypothetical protein